MRLLRETLGPELQDASRNPSATQALGKRLVRLGMLADAHLQGPLVDNQRIDLASLAKDALASVDAKAKRCGIRIGLSGFEDDLPPVYGSRIWLARGQAADYLVNKPALIGSLLERP